jgi:hypothetical protein
MSRQRDAVVTVVAFLVIAATVPSVLALADVRERQATDQQRQALVDDQVTERQAANDYDGDGISDGTDACPTRPETDNGYQDGDGCPDVVATTGAS